MKNLVRTTLVAVMSIAAFVSATAQVNHLEDPRYGATPEERDKNGKALSFLKFEFDMKNWDVAAEYVKQLMSDAPAAHAGIYQWGSTVYKNKLARAKTLDEKKAYVDSIVLIYDRRAEHFGSHPTQGTAYILALKARDYLAINAMDRAGVRQYYKDAIEAAGADVNPDLVLEYFSQLVTDFKAVEIDSDEFMTEYGQLSTMMENAEESKKDTFQSLFASSGAASCEILEELYTKQLAEQPDNIEILTKAYNMMSMIDCESDFYVSVAEKYYAAQPSSSVAVRLAVLFENKREFDRALKYLNEILPTETDPVAKANLYVRIAASERGANHSSAAAEAARQALELNPENGLAHYYLAEAYIAGSAACSDFQRQTVYWLVYDELNRASAGLEGEPAAMERVEQGIANARAYFPTVEDGFMKGLQNGGSYTVRCGWISGTTTVRLR